MRTIRVVDVHAPPRIAIGHRVSSKPPIEKPRIERVPGQRGHGEQHVEGVAPVVLASVQPIQGSARVLRESFVRAPDETLTERVPKPPSIRTSWSDGDEFLSGLLGNLDAQGLKETRRNVVFCRR